MSLCNLYQDIFLSGNMPNYNPTIHPPWHVSFVVKVVNVCFNTTAPTRYKVWRACTCVWYVDTTVLMQTTQYQMINTHALDNVLSWREWGKWWLFSQNSQYPGKVKRSKDDFEYSGQLSWKWKFITHFKSSVEGIKHTATI